MEALLEATLRLAAPLLLAALGELVIERAGLIDIGIEGTMLTCAFAGFVVAVASGSPLAGVAAAAGAGITVGALFSAFAVWGRVDQIVVGTAVNLIAPERTGVARARCGGAPPAAPMLGALAGRAARGAAVAGVPCCSRRRPSCAGWLLALAGISSRWRATRPGCACGPSANRRAPRTPRACRWRAWRARRC
jgi:ABC-type uncharacterized transport system permease subunit